MNLKSSKGFSLIELMVSMLILTAITSIGAGAYSLYMERWDGEFGKAQGALIASRNLVLLHRVMSSISPFVLETQDNQPVLFFRGDTSVFMGVTKKGIYSSGDSIFALNIENREDGVALVYYELPIAGYVLKSTEQTFDWQYSKVLISKMSGAEFFYYGWPSINDRASELILGNVASNQNAKKNWFQQYDAEIRGLHPEIMTLNITDANGGKSNLQASLSDKAEFALIRYKDEF